ncbi:uncharacterized protein F4822DRAFT_96932 [Hypoxylon trugodes]|uniref:uncharacterized protein n=1 Tax=Hypoxylon trugodes TaxID=326681 RepID=UPI00219BCF35|nr:uncharacterized protein F4822DRAFT_96932 [Hypoxylon trugodes]KAI1382789.1 hypothetical protein F4822DRAFT_96932 [Hypoxylon trugodes]
MALNEAHKSRIISHMNKDHSAELSQYLRAFAGVSATAARGAELTDMTLDTMVIFTPTSGSKVYKIPITPPLKSAADARERLVDMSRRAQQKLGLSDIRITTITPPHGGGIVSSAGVSLYFICAATLFFVNPETPIWGLLNSYFPYGAAGYIWLVKAIFLPVILIHTAEAWWMARTRLAPHGVETGSALWWSWTVNAFVEGWPALMRFDGLVEAEKKKKESGKH